MPKSPLDGQDVTFWGMVKEVFNWYPKEYPREERKLLLKLDLSILIYASLAFFIKSVDQKNISNAYVSGLKEDFHLYGNELNYFHMVYHASYVAFQIPGMIFMSRPKLARWLLPCLEVTWAIITFAQSRVTNVTQLYVLRFFLGMAEAPVLAGTHFVLGSWYTGPELFKRAAVWSMCNPLGGMISGYIQAAAYTNLSGVAGMSGWRWLFIIDGFMTVPVAILGFFVFPGIPDSPKATYLNDNDIKLALKRLEKAKVSRPGKITRDVFIRTLKRWHIWVFVVCDILSSTAHHPGGHMNLWLKQMKFSVVQINELPGISYAINMLATWFGTTVAGIYPTWKVYLTTIACAMFSTICMTIWHIPTALKFVAWYVFGINGCTSPILYSTINSIVKGDSEERALVMGGMIVGGYSFSLWLPLMLYPTSGPLGAPRWKIGWPASLAFYTLLGFCFVGITLLHRRDLRRAEAATDESGDGITNGVVVVESKDENGSKEAIVETREEVVESKEFESKEYESKDFKESKS